MKLTEDTFLLYAAKHYENPQCHDIIEFEEDMKRFQYLRKLFSRYKQYGDLKERLILNHLIIIYNCFGTKATGMLFLKLNEYHEFLTPFIEYLNYLPELVEYNGNFINTKYIQKDISIIETLKGI